MLNYLQKCRGRVRNKKAFTLMEVIVVISIIAILSSVAVPNAIRYQRRGAAREANEHALSFYNALQQSLLSVMEFDNTPHEFSWNGVRRITGANAVTSTAVPFFLYVRFENGISRATMTRGGALPVATSAEAQYVRPTGTIPADATTAQRGYTGANAEVFRLLMHELRNYTRGGTNEGNFYAMIDSEFRVTVVYYSRHADVIAGGMTVHQENRLACGRTFGSYPVFYSFTGGYNCRGSGAACTHSRNSGAPWFGNDVCANNVGVISARRR
jgi:prepilin-type N-terminal cleavage/methylation domain-containing protein